MLPRDGDVQHRLEGLVARACSKQQNGASLDPSLLSDIKALCRQSDEYVQMAWEALWGQLRASHAQVRRRRRPLLATFLPHPAAPASSSPPAPALTTLQSRLLALLLCEQLFQRSRAFRCALLGRLSQVCGREHRLWLACCRAAALLHALIMCWNCVRSCLRPCSLSPATTVSGGSGWLPRRPSVAAARSHRRLASRKGTGAARGLEPRLGPQIQAGMFCSLGSHCVCCCFALPAAASAATGPGGRGRGAVALLRREAVGCLGTTCASAPCFLAPHSGSSYHCASFLCLAAAAGGTVPA